MANKTSLTVIQLNDSHAYFDLHQEMFRQGGQAVYRPAGEENVGHTIGLPWFFFFGPLGFGNSDDWRYGAPVISPHGFCYRTWRRAEVRWGLPILPHLYNKKLNGLSGAGPYACTRCGQVEDIKNNEDGQLCRVCENDEWVLAIKSPRTV